MTAHLVHRMTGFGTSIFTEMSALARSYDAINLGQGFPDTDTPDELKRRATHAIADGLNQYPPARGMPVLQEAVASHQQRFYGLSVNPDTEVLVTVGASEAIAACILAVVEAGQEVITFDPSYDAYGAAIALAGGVQRTVSLRFHDAGFDIEDLRGAVSASTVAILVNNPHNPTGKVFSRSELEQIAAVARERDLLVITDEVYEHLTFDGLPHVPMATLPNMASRTLTISSGAKTFSATGWKVGWVHGPSVLIDAVATVKQYLSFTGAAPFQPAIAHGLGMSDAFFDALRDTMGHRRDLLVDALTSLGVETMASQGSYFVVADVAALGVSDALSWCRALPQRAGVAGVPVSAFCQDPQSARTWVRFGFCKQEPVLVEGARRLAALGRG